MPIRSPRPISLIKPRIPRAQRDELIDWSKPARLLEITPATPDRPACKNWPKRSPDPYSFETLRNIRRVAAEGPNQPLLLWSEVALRRPTAIVARPETASIEIDGRVLKHIVNYSIVADDGVTRIAVKGASNFTFNRFLAKRLRAIANAYRDAGFRYEIATAARLRMCPMAPNVGLIIACAARQVDDAQRKRILNALSNGAKTISELTGQGCPDRTRRDLAALHANEFITLDLLSAPIGPATVVTAGRVIQLPPWWRPSQTTTTCK